VQVVVKGATLKEALSNEHEQLMEFLTYAQEAGRGPEALAISQAHKEQLEAAIKALQRDTRYRLAFEPA
jgi:hypothetical protein